MVREVGEIKLASVHGQGSTFTLYLPLHYSGPDSARATPATGDATESMLGQWAR